MNSQTWIDEIGIDGVTGAAPTGTAIQAYTTNAIAPLSMRVSDTLAVGYHYATPVGHVNANTGQWSVWISGTIRG